MHPLLRSLRFTTDAGTESSVHDLSPIRDAAAPASRGIPLLLALGLTPLLIYGLAYSLISPSSRQAVQATLDQARRSVALLLFEPQPLDAKAPVRNLAGPEAPGGAGHQEGTGTLDPSLAAFTSILSEPSAAIDPDERGSSQQADQVGLSLNPGLPPQIGGNGLARGTGRDSTLGSGRDSTSGSSGPARGPALVVVPDFMLYATRRIQLTYQLSAGEEYLLGQDVQVRILISDDGVPLQATLVSGPQRLRDKAIRAALGWRFHPLRKHGLKGPLPLVITFRRPR